MFNFKVCSRDEINDFNSSEKKGHIFQTAYWCDFKKEWAQFYFKGVDSTNKIVLTASILVRKIPYLNSHIGYIPRGFVCDYSNKVLLMEFCDFLKTFCKQERIAFITIDPDIHLRENEVVIENGVSVVDTLKKCGFAVKDNASKNFEAIQPKFAFRLDISRKQDETIESTKKRVFSNFHSKWRYNIKLGAQRCLEVEYYDKNNLTNEAIDEFQRLMDITGERDSFIVRKKQYFKELIEKVHPGARLYLVKYNLKKDLCESETKLFKLRKDSDLLETKIEQFIDTLRNSSEEVIGEKKLKAHLKDTKKADDLKIQIAKLDERVSKLKDFGRDSIYLSGAIYLYESDKAWYLYGASSNDFRDTMTNFQMQWAMIQDSIDMGKDIYDFRGVSGDLDESNPLYGLYKFKKGFGGDFVEFIGEVDLIVNKPIYKLFKEVFPKYKKIRAKLNGRG